MIMYAHYFSLFAAITLNLKMGLLELHFFLNLYQPNVKRFFHLGGLRPPNPPLGAAAPRPPLSKKSSLNDQHAHMPSNDAFGWALRAWGAAAPQTPCFGASRLKKKKTHQTTHCWWASPHHYLPSPPASHLKKKFAMACYAFESEKVMDS